MAQGNLQDDLSVLIRWPREERNLEFKKSMDWADPATKAKLTKSVLAMANLRDGGHIVLGVERQPDDTYLSVGMQPDHLESFVQDALSSHFSEYADPYIEITLLKTTIDGKAFCVIRAIEFAELPVVCKKDGEKLRRGAMYTRSRRMVETVEVPGQVEMREILDLAIEKRSRAFARQAEHMGFARLSPKSEFVEQIKALPETEILKKIWSMGRWRVWIRPTVFEKARFQTLTACRVFMLNSAVNSEGWQYPLANNESINEADESIGSEVDFPPFVERWNLFRSGQFVWDFGFAEEYIGTAAWPTYAHFIPGKGKRYLSILRTLKIVTCIYEFASRMAAQHLLDPSASIRIELHGVDGRELSYISPQPRLDEHYWCRKESIQKEQSLNPEELQTKGRELALDVTLEIFKEFRWTNPPKSLLAEEQTRTLSK
jgi:hypothetical protein